MRPSRRWSDSQRACRSRKSIAALSETPLAKLALRPVPDGTCQTWNGAPEFWRLSEVGELPWPSARGPTSEPARRSGFRFSQASIAGASAASWTRRAAMAAEWAMRGPSAWREFVRVLRAWRESRLAASNTGRFRRRRERRGRRCHNPPVRRNPGSRLLRQGWENPQTRGPSSRMGRNNLLRKDHSGDASSKASRDGAATTAGATNVAGSAQCTAPSRRSSPRRRDNRDCRREILARTGRRPCRRPSEARRFPVGGHAYCGTNRALTLPLAKCSGDPQRPSDGESPSLPQDHHRQSQPRDSTVLCRRAIPGPSSAEQTDFLSSRSANRRKSTHLAGSESFTYSSPTLLVYGRVADWWTAFPG